MPSGLIVVIAMLAVIAIFLTTDAGKRLAGRLGIELPFRLQWLDTSNQDIWQNLALTSIGGLLSSTVLIILVLPALYYASVRMGWACRHIGHWLASWVSRKARQVRSA